MSPRANQQTSLTSVTSALDTPRQDPRTRERVTGHLLVAMSIVQIVLGLALILAPGHVARLLAGVPHTWPESAKVLRVAGGLALTIGAWCALGRLSESGLPRSRPLDLVPGLVVYNGCAVAVIADALLRGIPGPLLWPAFGLYLALLLACFASLTAEHAARR
jgi:hypothetical protein